MAFNDSLSLKPSDILEVKNQQTTNSSLTLQSAVQIITASVSGTVYDTTLDTGTKVSDATVIVYDNTQNAVAYVNTNADGVYLINGLTDATKYTINAYKDGYSISNTSEITTDATKVLVQNLVILPKTQDNSNIIYGTIKDSKGNKISNATVILKDSSTNSIYTQTTSIDDGEYAIYNVPGGTYTIQTNAAGFYDNLSNNIIVDANVKSKQDLTLTQNTLLTGSIVSGIITDNNSKAVSNAFVAIYSVDTNNGAETLVNYTYTNSQGRYIFSNIAEASYIIKAKLSASK